MNLFICNNGKLAETLALWIAGDINVRLKDKERYSLVLSGGSTPKALYELLAGEYAKKVEWNRVDFFWGDERYVTFEDERNNGKMAYETLLAPLGISEKNIYRIPTSPTPEEAAAQYAQTLRDYFGRNGTESFDLTLLGMGGDGHTLSVFPGSVLLDNETDLVKNVFNPRDQLQRITMLPHLAMRSGRVLFMIKGEDKSQTLHEVLFHEADPAKWPSQLFRDKDNVMWFTDYDAAHLLLNKG